MKKDDDRRELTGKVVLSDQVATKFLTEKESLALQTGMAIYDGILEKLESQNHGELPVGAEDDAVEQADQIVAGFGDALEKWAKGFRSVFTSGKG